MQDSATTKSAAETVHAHELSDMPAPVGAPAGEKVCCVCGKVVTHEERFKDKKGHYWCYECGVTDSHKRHGTDSVTCPECHQTYGLREMVLYEGHHLCADCAHKHALAMKREATRLAAALEAEKRATQQWRMMIGSAIVFAVVAIGLLVWRVL
jgi:hypothetical protein